MRRGSGGRKVATGELNSRNIDFFSSLSSVLSQVKIV